MGTIKLKKLLQENMKRFGTKNLGTKNLNEAVMQDTFYIMMENEAMNNYMDFSLTKARSLDDYAGDSGEYGLETIVFDILGYDRDKKNSPDYQNMNLDDFISLQDNWYDTLLDMAEAAGLTVVRHDDDEDEDYAEDEDEDEDDEDERESKKPVRKSIRLQNGRVVDIIFLDGTSIYSSYDKSGQFLFKCTVRGLKNLINQTFN
jgi:hypothetical protein